MYTTNVAFTFKGGLDASVNLELDSLAAEVKYVNFKDDDIDGVISMVEKDEVEERKTMTGSSTT